MSLTTTNRAATRRRQKQAEAEQRRLAEEAATEKRRARYRRPPAPALRRDVDQFVPDRTVQGELQITGMTLWRYTHDPDYAYLTFPPLIKINGHNFRSRHALEAWKQDRIREAVEKASRERV